MKQRLWSPCFSIFAAFVFKLFHKSHSTVTWTGWAGRVWAAWLSHSTLWCLCTPLPKEKQKEEKVMKQLLRTFPRVAERGTKTALCWVVSLRGQAWLAPKTKQRLQAASGSKRTRWDTLLSEAGERTFEGSNNLSVCHYWHFREALGIS